jgi:hypothetical protein
VEIYSGLNNANSGKILWRVTVTRWLKKQKKRVSQVMTPWKMYSDINRRGIKYDDDNRGQNKPYMRSGLDKQHLNHMHISIKP